MGAKSESASAADPATSSGSRAADKNKHPSGIIPTIRNIVAAVDLQSSLDLKAISSRAVNADYDPGRFEACVMRIRKPKTTAMVFENGKMIVTGARNDMEIKSSAKKFGRIIKKLGFEVKISQPKIQSIVAECETNFSIRIEDMAFEHADYSHYEPDEFPGLIYKVLSPKVSLLIFESGRVILAGAKSKDQIYQAFENIYPVLLGFKETK